MLEIYAAGRRAYTVEMLGEILGKTPSAVRSITRRRQIRPAAYVTKNVPVYYPEHLGIDMEGH